ncbi:MAG: hypothetical protein CMB95_06800 [Flavobacteriaceae bacterium]|nr:hypothetical protein [Flavobacteriaceae bacterium]
MNNEYDRDDTPAPHHLSLDEQLEVDTELNELSKRYDSLIERVYLMGYKKGLLHKDNTPHFP